MKKMIFLLAIVSIISIIAQINPQKVFGADCKFLCPEIDCQENVHLICQ